MFQNIKVDINSISQKGPAVATTLPIPLQLKRNILMHNFSTIDNIISNINVNTNITINIGIGIKIGFHAYTLH